VSPRSPRLSSAGSPAAGRPRLTGRWSCEDVEAAAPPPQAAWRRVVNCLARKPGRSRRTGPARCRHGCVHRRSPRAPGGVTSPARVQRCLSGLRALSTRWASVRRPVAGTTARSDLAGRTPPGGREPVVSGGLPRSEPPILAPTNPSPDQAVAMRAARRRRLVPHAKAARVWRPRMGGALLVRDPAPPSESGTIRWGPGLCSSSAVPRPGRYGSPPGWCGRQNRRPPSVPARVPHPIAASIGQHRRGETARASAASARIHHLPSRNRRG
jgi:hypothetical protein